MERQLRVMSKNAPFASEVSQAEAVSQLVELFHRLGFAVIVRDLDSAEVVGASPAAEEAMQAAEPDLVRVAAAKLGGNRVQVEIVRVEPDEPSALTPRQRAVGRLLVAGKRNTDIAEELNISTHTVRRHMEGIFRRLRVKSRAAAATALRNGTIKRLAPCAPPLEGPTKGRRSHDWPRVPSHGALAEELGTLLTRLQVPARICDGKGVLLFATPGVDAALAVRGVTGMQLIRIRLGGVTLFVTSEGGRSNGIDLTPRQRAVLGLIGEGLDIAAMATRLGISVHTVRRHVEGLLSRLQVRSRKEAVLLLGHYGNARERCGAPPPVRVA